MNLAHTYLVAGVDGGGTGCRVALADKDGVRLGEALGGPANFTTDPRGAIRSVRDAIKAAGTQAGLGSGWRAQCTAHIGLAGILSPEDARAVAQAMDFAKVRVSDDRLTSVEGALGERDGMLAAIGTGTIIAARNGGVIRFFGGWGHHLSDQASGSWLGHQALRRMMLAHDGLVGHSALTRTLSERFGNDPKAAVAFAVNAGPGDYAHFARTVIEAAQAGDATGCDLMQEGARYLHLCLAKTGLEGDAVLCLAGGVGPHYAEHLDPVWRARVRPPLGTALDGALRLAQRALRTCGGPS